MNQNQIPIRLDIGGSAILSVVLFLLLIECRNAGWPSWMNADGYKNNSFA